MRIFISLISLLALSNASPNPVVRTPRGTVYHIRPVSFRGGANRDNPFTNIEEVFPNFGLKDSLAQASSRYEEEDSTAEENVELPKYLEVSSSSSEESSPESITQRSSRNDKRKKQSNNVPLDASYAFGYTSDDQTRHEVADPGGNVNGYYQYVDDEGYVRKVVYTAGPGKGFVVLKKERVKGPVATPSNNKRPKIKSSQSFDIAPAASSNQLPPQGFAENSNSDRDNDNRGEADESVGYQEPPPTTRQSHSGGKKKKPIYIVKVRRPAQSQQQQQQQQQQEQPYGEYVTRNRDPVDYDLTPQRLKNQKLLPELLMLHKPRMHYRMPLIYAPSGSTSSNSRYMRRGSGQRSQPPQSPLVFLAGRDEEGYDDGSYREEYQYQSTGSSEDPEYPHHYSGNEKPDASYSFGYETETANRLEKADDQGNVRGSYSYIDSAGIKRTVHYVAGASTGFQILGTSPAATRQVRLEAPTGYVVSRRRAPSQPTQTEYRHQQPQQSTIVYHIHPDSQWKPWESTDRRKPRKMRKVMRVHRKKAKSIAISNPISTVTPIPFKNLEFTSSQKKLDQSEGTIVIQNVQPPSDFTRSFRHSTKVSTIRPELFESITNTRKRHASHRAYTDITDSGEDDNFNRNSDPILFSPNYNNEDSNSRRLIPNPILLKSSSVRVVNRGSDSIQSIPLEVAESKVYPVRATDTVIQNEALEPAESINPIRGYSTQEQIVPVAIVTDAPTATEATIEEESRPFGTRTRTTTTTTFQSTTEAPRRSGISGRPSSTLLTTSRSTRRRGQGQSRTPEPKTASPTVVRMTREETVKNDEDRDADLSTMSSSTRLLQRLEANKSQRN